MCFSVVKLAGDFFDSHTAFVVAKDHIRDPVQPILDHPMIAGSIEAYPFISVKNNVPGCMSPGARTIDRALRNKINAGFNRLKHLKITLMS